MNEFVPPFLLGFAIVVLRCWQQSGRIFEIWWDNQDNCNIVYIEAKNTKYSPVQ